MVLLKEYRKLVEISVLCGYGLFLIGNIYMVWQVSRVVLVILGFKSE